MLFNFHESYFDLNLQNLLPDPNHVRPHSSLYSLPLLPPAPSTPCPLDLLESLPLEPPDPLSGPSEPTRHIPEQYSEKGLMFCGSIGMIYFSSPPPPPRSRPPGPLPSKPPGLNPMPPRTWTPCHILGPGF